LLQFSATVLSAHNPGVAPGVCFFDFEVRFAARAAPANRPLTVRSALTNDPLSLHGVSGNSVIGRRYRVLVISFADDFGGVDKLSEAEKALCRQAATSVVASERLQADIVSGKEIDTEQLVRLTNVSTRLLARLKSKARPAAPASPLAAHFAKPPTREALG
jgi:hypothetical protein